MEQRLTKSKRKTNALNSIENEILREQMNNIWNKSHSRKIAEQHIKRFNSLESFCFEISKLSIEDITWEFLCDLVSKRVEYGLPCSHLLLFLLENKLYKGNYINHLLNLKDNLFNVRFKGIADDYYKKIFVYEKIKYVVWIEKSSNQKLFFIKTDNAFLFQILSEFCYQDIHAEQNKKDRESRDYFFGNISKIYGKYENEILSISDHNYEIFKYMEEQCLLYKYKILLLRKLYRYFCFLIEYPTNEGINIFKDYDPIDYYALKRDDMGKLVADGHIFIYYNPMANVPTDDKWILHINGHDQGQTYSTATTTYIYDFTKIHSSFHKSLIKEYIWNGTRICFRTRYNKFFKLTKVINFFTSLKDLKPEDTVTIDDIYKVRLYVDNMDVSISTKNDYLNTFGKYIMDNYELGKIKIEQFALDYLYSFGKVHNNTAKAIPEHDIEKLNQIMMNNAGNSVLEAYYYAIFHILIQTEFRLSQVCHLEYNCILPTVNKNQFIVTTSKTSNGQKYEAIITDYTKQLIDDAKKISENIRKECRQQDNMKYLFLHKTNKNRYVPVNGCKFREYMHRCCEEAGLDNYTPSNIRDFHMTKAEEENIRKGYSDLRLLTLSGHNHVDTTRNHYIENDLTKIIESMYGIIIGDVDIQGNIVDSMPANINNKKHLVENGCGNCNQSTCIITTTISCLMCKDFFTTFDRLSEFKKMIHHIDSLIESVKWEHDKDDLVNKKRLIAAYIVEIEKRKIERKSPNE